MNTDTNGDDFTQHPLDTMARAEVHSEGHIAMPLYGESRDPVCYGRGLSAAAPDEGERWSQTDCWPMLDTPCIEAATDESGEPVVHHFHVHAPSADALRDMPAAYGPTVADCVSRSLDNGYFRGAPVLPPRIGDRMKAGGGPAPVLAPVTITLTGSGGYGFCDPADTPTERKRREQGELLARAIGAIR